MTGTRLKVIDRACRDTVAPRVAVCTPVVVRNSVGDTVVPLKEAEDEVEFEPALLKVDDPELETVALRVTLDSVMLRAVCDKDIEAELLLVRVSVVELIPEAVAESDPVENDCEASVRVLDCVGDDVVDGEKVADIVALSVGVNADSVNEAEWVVLAVPAAVGV